MSTIALNVSETSSSFTPANSTIPSLLNSTLPSSLSTGYVPWWTGDWRYWFYFLAHLTGGAGLTLLLFTMCLPLRRVRRNPVLISMCFSWWLGSFPNTTLLFYTNNVLGAPPSQAVCLASAALVMAQTPLNAVCAVVLVYNVWSILYFTSARSTSSSARTYMLVCIPYVVFLGCAGAVLTVGLLRPELVGRATFYCVVRSNVLMIFLGVFGGACCVLAIGMEAWIAILLRTNKSKSTHKHNHHYLSNANRTQSVDTSASSRLDLQLAVRVVLFGFYIFFGLALSVISVFNWTSVVPDLCFSTFSIAVFAIFGSQQDVMVVWKKVLCCCSGGEQRSRRTTSHVRAGSEDSREGDPKIGHPFGVVHGTATGKGPHNPYWYRRPEKKPTPDDDKRNKPEEMGDLATLRTRNTTQTGIATGFDSHSPYNSQTDFQFQLESDIGLGMAGKGGPAAHKSAKSKDAWWGSGFNPNGKGGGKSKRPGTGNSAKRPGTGNSAMRPGTAGSQMSMSWYPDLGYDFAPDGTSHTADIEVEMDVTGYHGDDGFTSTSALYDGTSARKGEGQNSNGGEKSPGGTRKVQHANSHTRHSSATVPSEYIGTSPRSPGFIYYDPSPPPTSNAVPGLVPSTSLSPSSTSPLSPSSASPLSSFPILSSTSAHQFKDNIRDKEVVTLHDGVKQGVGQKGFAFPPSNSTDQPQPRQQQYQNPHAPTVNSRLHIEHRASPSTETNASIHFARNDSTTYLPHIPGHGQQDSFIHSADQYRDSTDAGGLPAYYLREYSHKHLHSTDYRSSLDSSVGGGARAAMKNGTYQYPDEQEHGSNGPTTLYDSNYPNDYDQPSPGIVGSSAPRYGYSHHANVSTHHRAVADRDGVYAPVPKSAFDRESNGFEFISGRKRTGGSVSPDSFLTNPSLLNGRSGYGY